MTITLPEPALTAGDLPLLSSNRRLQETLKKASIAAHASAILNDPLAFMLKREERLAADICRYQALSWLIQKAMFKSGEVRKALRNAPLLNNQQHGWHYLIDNMASELIEANYQQGWGDNNTHAVFNLNFIPISTDLSGTNPITQPHWALFVQAVMVAHWLDENWHMRAFRAEALDRGWVFREGAIALLAKSYASLRRADDSSPIRSTDTRVATSTWQRNINTAMAHYEDWR